MRGLAELFRLYSERRLENAANTGAWSDLAIVYDGNHLVRVSELDQIAHSAVPNLVAQGINGYARRGASVQPHVASPALRPNVASSRQRASQRGEVLQGWYDGSHMTIADYQRLRFYFGYGSCPAVIRGHPKQVGVPRWEVRSPMGVLPGPRDLRYSPEVPDCFVATVQSARWVRENYGVTFGAKVRDDELLEVVEYTDAEQVTIFCTGPAGPETPGRDPSRVGAFGSGTYGGYWSERGTHIERLTGPSGEGNGWLVVLSSTPNLAGTCLVSCPGVISLSKASGFVNGILARHDLSAKLMHLYIKGVQRGIFPNEWVIKDPNSQGEGVVTMADGLRGVIGVLDGGQVVLNQINPGYQTGPLIDKLEAISREEAGIPSEFGGASGANIRTRARGEAVLAETVDPPITEAHEILQLAREVENGIAIAYAKAYGGNRPRTISMFTGSAKKAVTYRAADLFETDETTVAYAVAGTDANGLVILAGQSVGTGMMSKHDARVLHPYVRDVEATERQLRVEALEDVALPALAQIIATSPEDGAYAIELAEQGKGFAEIFRTVQRRAQERQATVEAEGEPLGPAAPGSPEAQPGLGAPGVAEVPPSIAAPPQSNRNLAALVVGLHNGARQIERAS